MSKALALTQNQVRALCEGAKKAGFVPTIEVGGMLVRLIPKEDALPAISTGNVDEDKDIRL